MQTAKFKCITRNVPELKHIKRRLRNAYIERRNAYMTVSFYESF